MNKEDIRIGDVVEVKFQATVTGKNGDYANLDVTKTVVALEYYLIDKVIARKETKDEIIERLEAQLADAMQSLEELDSAYAQMHAAIEAKCEAELKARQTFGPSDKPRWNTCEGKHDAPWYPPQQEGYGPWIEGPPPADFVGKFQYLTIGERNARYFDKLAEFERKGYEYVGAIAHCIKLED